MMDRLTSTGSTLYWPALYTRRNSSTLFELSTVPLPRTLATSVRWLSMLTWSDSTAPDDDTPLLRPFSETGTLAGVVRRLAEIPGLSPFLIVTVFLLLARYASYIAAFGGRFKLFLYPG